MGHRLGGRGFPRARGGSPRVSAVFLFPSHAAGIPALLSCRSPAAALVWLGLVWLGTVVSPFHPARSGGCLCPSCDRSYPSLTRSSALGYFVPLPLQKTLHRVGKGSCREGPKHAPPRPSPGRPLLSARPLTASASEGEPGQCSFC